jgi:FkbM family methyltransferase
MIKSFRNLFFLRKITRKMGLNTILFKIIYRGNSYEELFDTYFSNNIKSDFCVYDVGANMGYYSLIFSKLVGEEGAVISFEPSLINFNKLNENVKSTSNITTLNIGVGNSESKLFISQGADDIGATSRISDKATENGQWVDIMSIDNIVTKNRFPNAIKIDVEGFEVEVIEGAINTLKNNELKVVGIEVHSEILEFRKIENPIGRMEKILIDAGFILEWTDFSHLVAYRA